MKKTSEARWLAIKQSYPIGCKVTAKILKHRPFGSFAEVRRADSKAIGLINIVQPKLYRAVIRRLPYNYTQRPLEGSDISCIICYYTDYNYQLGLGWLTDA